MMTNAVQTLAPPPTADTLFVLRVPPVLAPNTDSAPTVGGGLYFRVGVRVLILQNAHSADTMTVAEVAQAPAHARRIPEAQVVGAVGLECARPIDAFRTRVVERPATAVAGGGKEDGVTA